MFVVTPAQSHFENPWVKAKWKRSNFARDDGGDKRNKEKNEAKKMTTTTTAMQGGHDIILSSADGQTFPISRDAACLSLTIKNMLEDVAAMDAVPIPLPNVKARALGHVVRFCEYHNAHPEAQSKFTKGGKVDSALAKTAEWEEMPNMRGPRVGAKTAVLGGNIHVVGGSVSAMDLACSEEIEVFSTEERRWISSDKALAPSCMSAVVPLMTAECDDMGTAKRIYVIGGCDHTGRVLSTTRVFDVRTSEWSTLAPMKTARAGMQFAVVDDRFIWIFDGFNDSAHNIDSIEIFDAEKNEWFESAIRIRLKSLMAGTRAFAVGHKIFILDDSHVRIIDTDSMEMQAIEHHGNFGHDGLAGSVCSPL